MSDGVTVQQLEEALQRQREELLADVATLQAAQRPKTALQQDAENRRLMASGYEQEAARRQAEAESEAE
jgi:hypothetical protein